MPSPLPSASATFVYVLKDENLIKVNSINGEIVKTVQIPTELVPISFSYGKTFKTNVSQSYVAWFVPGKGMVRYHEQDKSFTVFYQPSDWFYENPYFQFVGDTNTLILIDKKGSEVVKYNLDSAAITQQAVPYPFGTLFKISPDLQRIVYVEGYKQTSGKPSYLITTSNGEPVTQFETNTDTANRGYIVWMPDSKALVTVEEGSKIVRYPIEQAAYADLLFTLEEGESVIGFEEVNGLLVVTSRSYWYLYDLANRKLIRRLPVDSMSQLRNPVITLLDANTFFIEEDVKSFEETYKRLWRSDWMGNKQIVIPAYGKRVLSVSM